MGSEEWQHCVLYPYTIKCSPKRPLQKRPSIRRKSWEDLWLGTVSAPSLGRSWVMWRGVVVEGVEQHGLPLVKATLASTPAECLNRKQYTSVLSFLHKPLPSRDFALSPSLGFRGRDVGAIICPIEIDTHPWYYFPFLLEIVCQHSHVHDAWLIFLVPYQMPFLTRKLRL